MAENQNEQLYFNRIAGLESEEEEDVKQLYHERIVRGKGTERIEPYEQEKTERDIQLIRFAERAVLAYRRKYVPDDSPLPLKRIHVLRAGGTRAVTGDKVEYGAYNNGRASILIDRLPSNIQFTLNVFHELFHLHAYAALQETLPDKTSASLIRGYRNGFMIQTRDGTRTYFVDVEEALTGIMERQFFAECVSEEPNFEAELEDGPAPDLSRDREVAEFNRIIDLLWEKNPSKFESRDKILDLFLKARATGHLLPVTRLVEGTFGHGGLRRLAGGTGCLLEPSSQMRKGPRDQDASISDGVT